MLRVDHSAPLWRVSRAGRICRALACRVDQDNISSLEAAVGTPSGQAFHWGLFFFPLSFLIQIQALQHTQHVGALLPSVVCQPAGSLRTLVILLRRVNPAQPSSCMGKPATPLPSKVAFVGPEGRRGHFLLHITVLYARSWERRGSQGEELLWSDHPQPLLFSSW